MHRRGWPLLALIGLALLVFQGLAFTDMILARGDTYTFFYPYWDARDAALRAGQLPLWTPDIFMGAPLLADPQIGSFYPPNWLTAGLRAPDAIRYSILLHVLWAGLGAYLLARRRAGLERTPALLAGWLYALGGHLGAHVEQINQLQGLAWLPWLFYLYDGLLAGRRMALHGLLLAGALALQIFSGHTQTVFIGAVGLAVYGLGHALLAWRAGGRAFLLLRAPLLLALAGMGAALLAAPQLIPAAELTALSNRQGGFTVQQATAFSLSPQHIGRGLLPSYDAQLFGEYVAYIGVAGLGLALLALLLPAAGPGRRARILWALLAVLGLALALGRYNPAYLLLAELPGFNFFRVPARWLALYALGGSLLAGIGLQALLAGRRPTRNALTMLLAALTGLMLLARFVLLVPQADINGPAVPTTATLLGWLAGLAGLLALLLVRLPAGRLAPAALLLVALELLLAARVMPYQDLTPPDVYTGQRFTASQLLAYGTQSTPPGRLLSISPLFFDPGDKDVLEARYLRAGMGPQALRHALVAVKRQEALFPNLPLTWGIPSVDGFGGGLLPTRHYSLFSTLLLPDGEPTQDGRLGELLALPECRGACTPETRWLWLADARWLLTDKVYDLWHEDIAYDTGLGQELLPAHTARWWTAAPFTATALHVLADRDMMLGAMPAGPGGLQPGGLLDFAVLPGDLWLARLEMPSPVALDEVVVLAAEAGQVYAVTLVDERTGSFLRLTPDGWQQALSSDIRLYENLHTSGRAFLVGDVQAVPQGPEGDAAALALMQEADFDPQRQAVLHGEAPALAGGPGGEAQVQAYEALRVEIHTRSAGPSYLILSDAFYPGWIATVDGQPAPVYRANLMFRAVYLPPGEHVVVWAFEPQGWTRALLPGAAAWLLLSVLLGMLARRGRADES